MDPIYEAYSNSLNEASSKFVLTPGKGSAVATDGKTKITLSYDKEDIYDVSVDGKHHSSYHTFGGSDETSKLTKFLRSKKTGITGAEFLSAVKRK